MKVEKISGLEFKTNNFFVSNIIGELLDSNEEKFGFVEGEYEDNAISELNSDNFNTGNEKEKICRTVSLENYHFFTLKEIFDSKNILVKSAVEKFLTKKIMQKTIGWFALRNFSTQTLSLQEISRHHQLSNYFAKRKEESQEEQETTTEIRKDHFFFLLFTQRHTQLSKSLHNITYTIMTSKQEKQEDNQEHDLFLPELIKLPLKIENKKHSKPYEEVGQKKKSKEEMDVLSYMDNSKFLEFQKENTIKLEKFFEKSLNELKEIEKEYEMVTKKLKQKEPKKIKS